MRCRQAQDLLEVDTVRLLHHRQPGCYVRCMTNTTRFDHTDCSHAKTAAARGKCRARRRADLIEAQAAFQVAWDVNETHEIREYEAIVDNFAYRWNMDLAAAYDLIENGPVVR